MATGNQTRVAALDIAIAALSVVAIAAAIILATAPSAGRGAAGQALAEGPEPNTVNATVAVVAPGASDHTTKASIELVKDGEVVAKADVAAQAAASSDGMGGVRFVVGEGAYTVKVAQIPYDYDGGAFDGERSWRFTVGPETRDLSHEFDLSKRDPLEMEQADLERAKAALSKAGIGYVEKKAPEPVWHEGWTETWHVPDAYRYPADEPAWQSADGSVWATREEAQAYLEETGEAFASTVVVGEPELVEAAHDVTVEHAGYYTERG